MALNTAWEINNECYSEVLKLCPKGGTLLELGSGTTTQKFVDAGFTVYSVEHDETWVGKSNGHYIYAPLENGWYSNLDSRLPEHYDVLLVDGPPGAGRAGLIQAASMFRHNIPWVIDDTHRKLDRQVALYIALNWNRPFIDCKGSGGKDFVILMPRDKTD